jgi:hypothetical protein
MATVRFKVSPGTKEESIVQEVGAANNSHIVELTVDVATTGVNEGASTRAIKKAEVLECLKKLENWIIKGNWLP